MKDEYIIINKTKFEKILEELEDLKRTQHANGDMSGFEYTYGKIESIKHVVSQSVPLITELKKAYWNGYMSDDITLYQYYLSNLKLEI